MKQDNGAIRHVRAGLLLAAVLLVLAPVARAAAVPAVTDVDAIPYFDPESAKARNAYSEFLKADRPRAFAIAASGAWAWTHGKNVEQRAIENCQRNTKAHCVLYAKGEKVVFPFDAKAASFADEDTDWGEPPTGQIRDHDYHAPTPTSIPGAKVITTQALRTALNNAKPPLLIDVHGAIGHPILPGAAWLPGTGLPMTQNANAEVQLERALQLLTGGDRSRAIVVFCQSAFCWLSYNAALRAVKFGYRHVSWYRGGVFAWRAAGLPTAEAGVGTAEVAAAPPPAATRGAQQGAVAPKPPPASTTPPGKALDFDPGRFHALIIGNNDYRTLPKLKTAIGDATAVAEVLRAKYGFDVTMLTNATRYQILTAMAKLRGTLKLDDNLLIYYAGHGVLDEAADRGYWLPVDAEADNPANWVSTADLTDNLRALDAQHVLIIADSCYSGTLTRGVAIAPRPDADQRVWLKRVEEKRSRTALTSGGLEPVMDGGGSGHSVFTKSLLEALNDNNDAIDGEDLFNLVRRPVVLNADQTPSYSDIRSAGHDGGDFIFVPSALQRAAGGKP